MKEYEIVLFDLDGTLTDPGEGITNSVAYALNKFGIAVEDKKQLYPFIGPPLHESFENYYGFSPEDAMKAVDCYREYYNVKGIFEKCWFKTSQYGQRWMTSKFLVIHALHICQQTTNVNKRLKANTYCRIIR